MVAFCRATSTFCNSTLPLLATLFPLLATRSTFCIRTSTFYETRSVSCAQILTFCRSASVFQRFDRFCPGALPKSPPSDRNPGTGIPGKEIYAPNSAAIGANGFSTCPAYMLGSISVIRFLKKSERKGITDSTPVYFTMAIS